MEKTERRRGYFLSLKESPPAEKGKISCLTATF